jgi:hypothetical protein
MAGHVARIQISLVEEQATGVPAEPIFAHV